MTGGILNRWLGIFVQHKKFEGEHRNTWHSSTLLFKGWHNSNQTSNIHVQSIIFYSDEHWHKSFCNHPSLYPSPLPPQSKCDPNNMEILPVSFPLPHTHQHWCLALNNIYKQGKLGQDKAKVGGGSWTQKWESHNVRYFFREANEKVTMRDTALVRHQSLIGKQMGNIIQNICKD